MLVICFDYFTLWLSQGREWPYGQVESGYLQPLDFK